MQQPWSQPFINFKRQAVTKAADGPKRNISSKDKEIEISLMSETGIVKALVTIGRHLSLNVPGPGDGGGGGGWCLFVMVCRFSMNISSQGAEWPHTVGLFIRSNQVLCAGFQAHWQGGVDHYYLASVLVALKSNVWSLLSLSLAT